MYFFILSREFGSFCTLFRDANSFSLAFIFFHAFGWTRTYMPFPFFPSVNPRYLKFFLANTLAVLLFSRLTFSFSFPSR